MLGCVHSPHANISTFRNALQAGAGFGLASRARFAAIAAPSLDSISGVSLPFPLLFLSCLARWLASCSGVLIKMLDCCTSSASCDSASFFWIYSGSCLSLKILYLFLSSSMTLSGIGGVINVGIHVCSSRSTLIVSISYVFESSSASRFGQGIVTLRPGIKRLHILLFLPESASHISRGVVLAICLTITSR